MNSSMNSTFPTASPILDFLPLVRKTFGTLQICAVATVGLLGLTTLQTWFYYRTYPTDNRWMKSIVLITWCVEFARSSFVVYSSYYYSTLNWGNILVLDSVVWAMKTLTFMTNIAEIIVQVYFAWRVWTLGRGTSVGWVLATIIMVVSLWNFGMGATVFVLGLTISTWTSYDSGTTKVLVPFSLSTSVMANIAVTSSMSFLLHRRRTGLARTNHIINTLIFYTIEAGALIVVVDLIVIILNQLTNKTGFAYVGLYATVGNLYANSLLASLNARASLQASSTAVVTASSQSTSWRSAISSATFWKKKHQGQPTHNTVHSNIGQPSDTYELHMISSSPPDHGNVDTYSKAVSLDQLESQRDPK